MALNSSRPNDTQKVGALTIAIAAAAENDLTTGCVLCASASPLSLGSSKDLFWGWNEEMEKRDVREKDGWAPGLFAFFQASKHIFQIRW